MIDIDVSNVIDSFDECCYWAQPSSALKSECSSDEGRPSGETRKPRRSDCEGRQLVVELRARGLSFTEIGQRLGITRQRAHQLATVNKRTAGGIRCCQCGCKIIAHFPHARLKDEVYCHHCLQQKPRATFGQRLRACRIAAGMSRQALAKHSGLFAGTITHLEQGKRLPYTLTMERLVQVLGDGLLQ